MRIRSVLAGLFLAFVAPTPLWATGQAEYEFTLGSTFGPIGSEQDLTLMLDSSDGNPLQGWAYGICHDPEELDLVAAVEGASVLTVNNGSPPDFHPIALFEEGVTVGCVVCFTGCAVLPVAPDHEFLVASYQLTGAPGTVAMVEVCDTLGDPVVQTLVVDEAGLTNVPVSEPGFIEIFSEALFLRGDCNQDFGVDIADGIYLLAYLFLAGPAPSCQESCDSGGDTSVDFTDALFIFQYQLLDGPPPPAPFPQCGSDGLVDCDLSACSS